MLSLVRFSLVLLILAVLALIGFDGSSNSTLHSVERSAQVQAALLELAKHRARLGSQASCQPDGADCADGRRTLAAIVSLGTGAPLVQQGVVHVQVGSDGSPVVGEFLADVLAVAGAAPAPRVWLCDLASARTQTANVGVLLIRADALTPAIEDRIRRSDWLGGALPAAGADGCSTSGRAIRDEIQLTAAGVRWRLWTREVTGEL